MAPDDLERELAETGTVFRRFRRSARGCAATRDTPGSPHRRSRELPLVSARRAYDAILSVHESVAAAGYVALDL